jgi:hypothetical protein
LRQDEGSDRASTCPDSRYGLSSAGSGRPANGPASFSGLTAVARPVDAIVDDRAKGLTEARPLVTEDNGVAHTDACIDSHIDGPRHNDVKFPIWFSTLIV